MGKAELPLHAPGTQVDKGYIGQSVPRLDLAGHVGAQAGGHVAQRSASFGEKARTRSAACRASQGSATSSPPSANRVEAFTSTQS